MRLGILIKSLLNLILVVFLLNSCAMYNETACPEFDQHQSYSHKYQKNNSRYFKRSLQTVSKRIFHFQSKDQHYSYIIEGSFLPESQPSEITIPSVISQNDFTIKFYDNQVISSNNRFYPFNITENSRRY